MHRYTKFRGVVSTAVRQAFVVSHAEAGMRLDRFLVPLFPDTSRSRLSGYIRSRWVLVNDNPVKGGHRLRCGDRVTVELPPPEPREAMAEEMDLQIVYEDSHLLVLNKPPGLVVHPGAGHTRGTLVGGLLHHCPHLPGEDRLRPGIVHRLDKDTSGILVVAKTELVMQRLGEMFRKRQVVKTYLAVLARTPPEPEGRVVAPLGRHPVQRKKMAVRPASGRFAATRWRIVETFANSMCLAEIVIETGRTHQIRVHMSYQGTPVVGDALYGGRGSKREASLAGRQLLHASAIGFRHPADNRSLCFKAPLWPDMEQALNTLRDVD